MLAEFMQGRKNSRRLQFATVSCVYSMVKISQDETPIGYRLDCCPEQVFSSEEEVMMWLQLNYADKRDFGGLVLNMDDAQSSKFTEAWKTISTNFDIV